jgi:mono/diheme cytochrome c family protein
MHSRYYLALALSTAVACDEDEGEPTTDASVSDAGHIDAAVGPSMDASLEPLDGWTPAPEASTDRDAQILRGKYLTQVIYPCGGCHTPRNTTDKVFSGVDCWTDTLPMDADAGCLGSRNLTNHQTGIGNLTDTEVKNAFLKGERSDGKALHPQMPYPLLGNMREDDAVAIVTFLRSLPPIDHRVQANQPPFDVQPATPAPGWPQASIPMPRADYPDQAAAMRGRYLAGNFGGCMDCHTPRDMKGAQLRSEAFSGGRKFGDAYAPNLTPDPTGIEGYSLDDIVRAIKRGEDPDQNYSKLCPPMPAGPMGAYGGMTDDDARDIAHYLFSIPPVENMIAGDCQPDAGM